MEEWSGDRTKAEDKEDSAVEKEVGLPDPEENANVQTVVMNKLIS